MKGIKATKNGVIEFGGHAEDCFVNHKYSCLSWQTRFEQAETVDTPHLLMYLIIKHFVSELVTILIKSNKLVI